MKCVQLVGQGIPVRLSDSDADQIVRIDFDGQYCAKHIWKKFHDDNHDDQFKRRVSSRIDQKGRIV